MTAYFIVRTPKKLSIVSDTAVSDEDRALAGHRRKVIPADSWNGATLAVGAIANMYIGTGVADSFASFDEFIEKGAEDIKESVESFGDEHSSRFDGGQLWAVGWSEKADRPAIFCIGLSGSTFSKEFTPFRWYELPAEREFLTIPALDSDFRHLGHWLEYKRMCPGVNYSAKDFRPDPHGIVMFDALRTIKRSPELPGTGQHVVGGSLDLTVIEKAGLTQQVLKTYPDKIGEYIRPAPLEGMENILRGGRPPVQAPPMNRQQRRAAARAG